MNIFKICENEKYEVIKKLIKYREGTYGPDAQFFAHSLYVYFLKRKHDQLEVPIEVQTSWNGLAENKDESFTFLGKNELSWTRLWVMEIVNTGILGNRPRLETRKIVLTLGADLETNPKIFFSNQVAHTDQLNAAEKASFVNEGFSLTWHFKTDSLEIAFPKPLLEISYSSH